ncbi:autotransporter outer membrane beta-barrel domain-containing protein [Photorhabdus heterorhabditis]|uniref:autotransporter outer membrane beta-barrel domain-containing protein n=1 Tax=Photorhabdus heterorhabditis TaxID=880156 RepID=UPI001BD52A19|nr:autotransporter outer membrane beta-barrel domain-containing protein [Photorhabdus heterorhabditis]MBS9443430.1 autotransporter outer membrane beta-barrel domain-containing protein [Photorhabdus heterorhabditis]
MKVNNYKKSAISIGIASFLIGLSNTAWSWDRLDNEQIKPNTTYNDADLTLDKQTKTQRIKITGDTIFRIQGDSQATDTVVEDNSHIQMSQFGYNNTLGNPVIQNTTVNGRGRIDMGAGSVSFGQLFIGKDAELSIDNNDMYFTNVSVNSPVPAGNVYIENLTLAGVADIASAWTGDGEDGDAPLPEKPGPVLVTRIDNLTMQLGSKLKMEAYASGVQFNRLELKNLSGEGNFYLTTSLADGLSDKIYVSERASGKFGLQVNDSGREVVNPKNVQLVYINSGDAHFNLLNNGGIVEAGVWQYKLHNKTENGHTEWYLVGGKLGELAPQETNTPSDTNTDTPLGNNSAPLTPSVVPHPVLSNSARAVINMATAPWYILETETSTLRQRMGDLRRNDGSIGVWTRYLSDNSRLNDKRYSAFHSNLNGMQLGADKKTEFSNGTLLLGVFTSYSKSNIKSDNTNNGNIRSYGGGVYTTWFDNSGLYMDTLLKANHLSNEVRTNMNSGNSVKGNYSQNTITASTEAGYSIKLTDAFSLTPYGKVAYSRTGKADYSLDNGMEANVHAANSLRGEVGTLLESEFSIAEHSVRPYAKTAVSREFIKNNEIEINNVSFDSNYSGNVGKYGLGVTADVGGNALVYTEVNYQKGNKVETPIYATAGFRVSF